MGDDMFDAAMRAHIDDVADRLGAAPEDIPTLGFSRDDGSVSCWHDDDWHIATRERGSVIAGRHTADPALFLSWIAESITENMANRRHSPESDDYRRNSWAEQYRLLASLDPGWAKKWLGAKRAEMIRLGAGQSTLDKLPNP